MYKCSGGEWGKTGYSNKARTDPYLHVRLIPKQCPNGYSCGIQGNVAACKVLLRSVDKAPQFRLQELKSEKKKSSLSKMLDKSVLAANSLILDARLVTRCIA